jgi:hypothetical protein
MAALAQATAGNRQEGAASGDACPTGATAGSRQEGAAGGNARGTGSVRSPTVASMGTSRDARGAGSVREQPAGASSRYGTPPEGWKQQRLIGDPAKCVNAFITDAEANRARAIQIVSNGEADPRRTQLRAKGNKECARDTDEPQGGWYDGYGDRETLEQLLIAAHEDLLRVSDTNIEELQALLRTGYGEGRDPFVYGCGDQADHADVPDATLEAAGNISAVFVTGDTPSHIWAGQGEDRCLVELPANTMTIVPGSAYHAGATHKADNTILHYYLIHDPPKFEGAVRNTEFVTCARELLDMVMLSDPPVDADEVEMEYDDTETVRLKQRVQDFGGMWTEAHELVMEILNKELGDNWITAGGADAESDRMGTIGADAIEYLDERVRDGYAGRAVYDIGAGYGAVLMTLRLLKTRATGCEKSEEYCSRANEIGAKYFGDWEDIEHASFESVTLNPDDDIVYYVNNLAFRDQHWLVKALQPLVANEDNIILSTDFIPGLGSELKHCQLGDAFTLAETSSDLTALHSGNDTTFKFRTYIPTPLEELFTLKRPYATFNGNRSLSVLFRGHDIVAPDYITTRDGKFVYAHTRDNCLEEQRGWKKSQPDMYAMLSNHNVLDYAAPDKRRFLVRRAFAATFSRSNSTNMPSVHHMRVWMILYCSERHECGQGFLDVDSGPYEQLADGEYLLPNKPLRAHGVAPLRRSGHPEYEAASGSSSGHIGMYECWRLQLANATGGDVLTTAQVLAASGVNMISGQNPTLLQVGQALEHFTALLLVPQDDLHGNLHAAVLRKTGMYLLETSWPGQQYGHTLLWDAERHFLCMGRTKPGSIEQHTIRPVKGDFSDPAGRLREEYGYVFTVNQVYQIMIKTRRLSEVPLAAYDPPPLTEGEQRKEAKRKAWMTRNARSGKRVR